MKFITSCALGSLLLCSFRAAASDAVYFLNPDLQLGTVGSNTNVPVTFVLTNSSAATVKIISAEPSCECTTVLRSPSEIRPHSAGNFDLSFDTSRASGMIIRTFSVELADGQVTSAQFTANISAAPTENNAAPAVTNAPTRSQKGTTGAR